MKEYEGLTLREFAERTGKHPVDAMLDLAVADDLRTEFYAPGPNQNMEFMKEMIDYPYLIPGVSDGGAHTKFFTGGQYPTEFLAWLVRELQDVESRGSALAVSALCRRMCAGFRDRGSAARRRAGRHRGLRLRQAWRWGRWKSRTTFRAANGGACARPTAIAYIMVNGEITMRDGVETGASRGTIAAPRQGAEAARIRRWSRRFKFFKRKPGLSASRSSATTG